jgi:hypothetical protein
MHAHRKTFTLAALALTAGIGAAFAQAGPGPGPGGPGGAGPMMGQGRMMDGHHGMGGMGGPGGGGPLCRTQDSMVPRMAARLETTVKPTDAQKADFEALKAAMTKAEATLKAACPTQAELADRTPPARLALAEKRMAAGLDAIRTVRPAFDALYAKLDDKQRDAMRWMRGPMGMMDGGRREHHGWWGWNRG